MGIYKQIMAGQVTYPIEIKGKAKDLITKLLVSSQHKRLGGGQNGANAVREDAFFPFDFEKLEKKEYVAPWVPALRDARDTTNFDTEAAAAETEEDEHQWEHAAKSPTFAYDLARLDAEFSSLEPPKHSEPPRAKATPCALGPPPPLCAPPVCAACARPRARLDPALMPCVARCRRRGEPHEGGRGRAPQ